ncbi:hypothetical protein E2562_029756 [Oryza meyeriana var. granulata]|uniref:Uncharacterized protein n=1 Tax=Oryza meyeriana var. granulata TaxID=110450 RepID=A0A6G1CJA5_9ORYZ|nr:hypothetical protein E2562_029756 [Oryza meyeriana var. granulata]
MVAVEGFGMSQAWRRGRRGPRGRHRGRRVVGGKYDLEAAGKTNMTSEAGPTDERNEAARLVPPSTTSAGLKPAWRRKKVVQILVSQAEFAWVDPVIAPPPPFSLLYAGPRGGISWWPARWRSTHSRR